MATAHHRGHAIVFDYGVKSWRYKDNGAFVSTEERPCAHCGKEYTDGEIDPCLGRLPGVTNACCGHGGVCKKYIQYDSQFDAMGFKRQRRKQKRMVPRRR